jgi:peroxiredoxin
MKRFFVGILGLALGMGAVSPTVLADATPGNQAPEFSLPASDGKTYNLSDYKGKWVVLEWTNKNCPFVKKHYGSNNMQKLQETYIHKGVNWFSICSSAPGKEGYMTERETTRHRVEAGIRSTASLLDPQGKVGKMYGAKTTPHMFIIDPKGIVVYAGAIDDHNSPNASDIPKSKNYVSAALDEALAGKPVTTASTQPYGCSVKYKN